MSLNPQFNRNSLLPVHIARDTTSLPTLQPRPASDRHALLNLVTLANRMAEKGMARPRRSCTMKSSPSWL